MMIKELEKEFGITPCPHGENSYCSPCVVGLLEKAIAVQQERIIERLRAWKKQYEIQDPSSLDRVAQTCVDSAIKIVQNA